MVHGTAPGSSSTLARRSVESSDASVAAGPQNATGVYVDGASAAPHVGSASAPEAPATAGPVLGKRKRVDVGAIVEGSKLLGGPALTKGDLSAPLSHPGAQVRRASSPGDPFAPMAASVPPAGTAAHQRLAPSQAPPPPSSSGRLVNLTRQVAPPPRAQPCTVLSELNVTTPAPPKKRARGRAKKDAAEPAEQPQGPVVVDIPDEEFDSVVAEMRGALEAFEAARSAFVSGWHANQGTAGVPLPALAVARVRAPAEVVSASPWLNGEKQVCPPAASRLDLIAPYGDYDPITGTRVPPATALTHSITRLSDPLFICRPFPYTRTNGPPPVDLHFTSKPCPATGHQVDLLAITPRPFIPYPAALGTLRDEDVDKALTHIRNLAHVSPDRVDQAAKASGCEKPVGKERDLATKSALAYLVHRAMELSRPLLLPEDLRAQKAPKAARRTWKRVKRVYPGTNPGAPTPATATASGPSGTATTKSTPPQTEVSKFSWGYSFALVADAITTADQACEATESPTRERRGQWFRPAFLVRRRRPACPERGVTSERA